MYCASQWAIEGYCDTLAYEVAPFNIRVTIIQTNMEISVLANRIVAVPPMPEYMPPLNPAPLSRHMFARILDQVSQDERDADSSPRAGPRGDGLRSGSTSKMFPSLKPGFRDSLIAETVTAIAAIGGHENPPTRHIVGFEAVTSVKEKLKTVSEELEDFIEVSGTVDLS